MKKILLASLICCGINALALADCCDCDNDTTRGFYVGAIGGLNFLNIDKNGEIAWDVEQGYVIGGSMGYRFCNRFRLEGEAAYRHNSPGEIQVGDWGDVELNGHITTTTFMANIIYDFDIGSDWTPSLGLGAGYGITNAKLRYFRGSFGGKEERFAYQGIAGLSRYLNANTNLGLEYRYLHAAKHSNNHSVALAVRRYF